MSSHIRQKQLLDYVNQKSVATVQQLVDFLSCSPATIRRDIHDLAKEGKLSRIRNGAEKILSPNICTTVESSSFYPKISDYNNYYLSDRIAEKAVGICQSKDIIFIASGNTTFLMGQHLLDKNINVYSNHVQLFSYLISESYSHLFIVGGQYIKNHHSLAAPDTQHQFQGRYLFIEADGLTSAGISKSAILSYMEEKRILRNMDKIVVLVDPTNINVSSGIPQFTLDEIDIVITGKDADPAVIHVLEEQNVEVILV